MDMVNKVLQKIDELYEKYLTVWKDVCDIESQTSNKEGVDKVAEYILDIAREHGWDVEYCYQEVGGNAACITLNPNAKGVPFCFSGHMDTVHEKGLFGYPPTKIIGDKIYGPGVADCKGGIVIGLLTLDALDACGYKDRPVKLILQSDEELNSKPSKRETIKFMIEKGLDSCGFINLESNTDENVCIQRKGIATYTFNVKGISAHGSLCAIAGANAIAEAAYKIIEVEKLKDHEGVTCNCGVIKGGSVANTVPEECEFKCNVRFATAEQRKWVDKFMQDIADDVKIEGCKTTVTASKGRPPMEYSDKNQKLLDDINAIFEKFGFSTVQGQKRTGGSDTAYTTEAGIPCLDCFGVIGDRIHSKDEFAYIESLRDRAKRLALITMNLK